MEINGFIPPFFISFTLMLYTHVHDYFIIKIFHCITVLNNFFRQINNAITLLNSKSNIWEQASFILLVECNKPRK